jgi:hypothetical protein
MRFEWRGPIRLLATVSTPAICGIGGPAGTRPCGMEELGTFCVDFVLPQRIGTDMLLLYD